MTACTPLLWLLVVAHVRPTVTYNNGASTSACRTMIPGHGTRMTSSPPYFLDIGETIQYSPGVPVTVTIRGGPFAGVLLQVRDKSGTSLSPIGTFKRPGTGSFLRLLKCENIYGSAVTHSIAYEKTDAVIQWNPPDEDVGEIQFVATIARSQFEWWREIRSTSMIYRPPAPTPILATQPPSLAATIRPASSGAAHPTHREKIIWIVVVSLLLRHKSL